MTQSLARYCAKDDWNVEFFFATTNGEANLGAHPTLVEHHTSKTVMVVSMKNETG